MIGRRPAATLRDDSGSILPLLIGFFVLAGVLVTGGIAVGDALVQQRGLQDVCDGAAVAAAAGAARLDRADGLDATGSAPLSGARAAVVDYLSRDPARRPVEVGVALGDQAHRLDLTCVESLPVPFGAVIGRGAGVRHIAHSSARAALSVAAG